jgi:hypothetical protein
MAVSQVLSLHSPFLSRGIQVADFLGSATEHREGRDCDDSDVSLI